MKEDKAVTCTGINTLQGQVNQEPRLLQSSILLAPLDPGPASLPGAKAVLTKGIRKQSSAISTHL